MMDFVNLVKFIAIGRGTVKQEEARSKESYKGDGFLGSYR